MRGLFFKIQRVIGELQNADLKTRKRWLIGLSGVSMIFVVILWVVYLNITFPSYNSNSITGTVTTSTKEVAEPAQKEEVPVPAAETSFFGILGRGFGVLEDEVGNGFRSLGTSIVELWDKTKNTFSKTNSYELEKQNTPPVEEKGTSTPDPIPPTPLPELPGVKKP